MKKVVSAIIILTIAIITYSVVEENNYNDKLKSGEIILECTTKENGTFTVSPTDIVSFDTESQTVYFKNGYATSCEVK